MRPSSQKRLRRCNQAVALADDRELELFELLLQRVELIKLSSALPHSREGFPRTFLKMSLVLVTASSTDCLSSRRIASRPARGLSSSRVNAARGERKTARIGEEDVGIPQRSGWARRSNVYVSRFVTAVQRAAVLTVTAQRASLLLSSEHRQQLSFA